MQYFVVLDLKIEETLQISKELEVQIEGDWVYFDASDGVRGKAIFKASRNGSEKIRSSKFAPYFLEAHENFLDHLLGLFTPTTDSNLSVYKLESFTGFCTKLNDLLKQEKKIYDLSRSNFWIWSEGANDEKIVMGDKLKNFLEIT